MNDDLVLLSAVVAGCLRQEKRMSDPGWRDEQALGANMLDRKFRRAVRCQPSDRVNQFSPSLRS